MTTSISNLSPDGIDTLLPRYCLLPNLLSLDAALFAVCWQWMATQAFGIELTWVHALLLATAVWLGYTADRWLDALGMKNAPNTLRHRFAARHQRGLLLAWIVTLTISILCACSLLSSKELVGGFGLAGLCALNAWLNHLDSVGRFRFPAPKELRAAFLLAAGIHLFVWTRIAEVSFSFWLSFATVTLLCFLNCCFVAKWEMRIDLHQGQSSLALRRKELDFFAARTILAPALICGSIACLRANAPDSLMLYATAIALLALPMIDLCKLGPEDKRVLADASLFIPCLVLV